MYTQFQPNELEFFCFAFGSGGVSMGSFDAVVYIIYNRVRDQRGLRLATPRGEPTWERGTRKAVIDLTFLSDRLQNRLIFCGPEPRWALTQDHIPIRVAFDLQARSMPTRQRFALHRLDQEGLRREVQASGWQYSRCPLSSLQALLKDALPRHCPLAKPGIRARPDWSPRAATLVAGVRHARRR